jgi:hypothetical protein
MYWVRILDALAARGAEPSVIEAEVAAETFIPGMLTYAGHGIVFGPMTVTPDASGLYKYLLRVQQPMPGEPIAVDTIQKTSSRDGYLVRGAPVTELVALFSLVLPARLFVLSTTMRPLDPQYLPRKTECDVLRATGDLRHKDSMLFSARESRNIDTSLSPLLDAIRRVPAKHHLKLAVAADHYARAIRAIGLEAEMVFVRLVSAIERVMPEHPADSLSKKLLALEGLAETEREELQVTLQARRACARFVAFLERYANGFFDNEPREPAHTQVTPENLAAVATAIYRARSGYLHSGDPMYISERIGFPGWHMDPTVGKWEQNRAFTAAQKLPTTEFFHRLVRHCLLARIEELGRTEDPTVDAGGSALG